MNELDPRYIEEAEEAKFTSKKNLWRQIGGIAASFVIVAALCTVPFWGYTPGNEIGGEPEISSVLHWNPKTGTFYYPELTENQNMGYTNNTLVPEGGTGNKPVPDIGTVNSPTSAGANKGDATPPHQYYTVPTGDYADYQLPGGTVAKNLIGDPLGQMTMRTEDKSDALTVEVFAISSIDSRYAVAILYPETNTYRVLFSTAVTPATFGELMKAYTLKTELYMGMVLAEHVVATNSDRLVEAVDVDALKAMIFALDGEACTLEELERGCRGDLSAVGISATHSALWKSGVGSIGIQIFEKGYLATNLGGKLYTFRIDKGAASDILDHCKSESYENVLFYGRDREIIERTQGGNSGDVSETTAAPPYNPTAPVETSDGYNPNLTTPGYDRPVSSTEEDKGTYAAPDDVTTESETILLVPA